MEEYRTEEEQVEALRRWWDENGRSTIAAVVIALAAGLGWQSWQTNQERQAEQASDLYQALLRVSSPGQGMEQQQQARDTAEILKSNFSGSTYAQFAALHLAAMAVNDGNLAEAEAQLRWVLGKADAGSDVSRLAQVRLARVLASSGDTEQALTIIAEAGPGSYGASYAAAKGDILLAAGRDDEARDAYTEALALAGSAEQGINLPALQQKLQSLTPVPARSVELAAQPQAMEPAAAVPQAPAEENDSGDNPEG